MTVLGLILWFASRGWKVTALAGALLFLPVLPALNALRVYEQGNMAHDRYLYLPSLGLCLFVALGLEYSFARRPRARMVLVGALVVLFAWQVYLNVVQQRYYRNDEASLFRGLEIAPQNSLLMEALGRLYLKQGNAEPSLVWFRKAEKTAPENPHLTLELARGLFQTGHRVEAEETLAKLIQRPSLQNEQRALGLLYLANVHVENGSLPQAEHDLDTLKQVNPKYPGLHRTLGIVFQKEQRLSEAEYEYATEFEITGDQEAKRQAAGLRQFLRQVRARISETCHPTFR